MADDEEEEVQRSAKVRKHDVELPIAEADIKLAEKLDACLKISPVRKARFFMNKPRCETQSDKQQTRSIVEGLDVEGKLKPKNLSRDKMRERLLKKYDSLVPELDPKRPSVKLVKVLSATESIDMAMREAKKQLVDQMELNSVRGNERANREGVESFRFNDGYESAQERFYTKKFDAFQKNKSNRKEAEENTSGKAKTVKFEEKCGSTKADSGAELYNPHDIFVIDDEFDKLTDDEESAR